MMIKEFKHRTHFPWTVSKYTDICYGRYGYYYLKAKFMNSRSKMTCTIVTMTIFFSSPEPKWAFLIELCLMFDHRRCCCHELWHFHLPLQNHWANSWVKGIQKVHPFAIFQGDMIGSVAKMNWGCLYCLVKGFVQMKDYSTFKER